MILDRRMAFFLLEAGAAKRHALVDQHVVADFRGLADHDAHAVIDEEAPADVRAGMDFDAGDPARELAQQPAEQLQLMLPQPMRHAIEPDGVQSRIAEHHFERGARGRVAVEDRLDVFAHSAQNADRTVRSFCRRRVVRLVERHAA